ncbi:M23 family peptidase [Marivirga lumbricoides]|uniref:M23 family peptidase n=1 Tax=Marivirga lumbricoides TaxID=1046115 RepID=A0A2T4DNQ6_9BACT|nr:M23 family peptidase [Marivirga lumbricoides]
MKLNKAFTLIFLSFYSFSKLLAQTDETYLFPINPGNKNYLAGTMGELRSSHFHAGIDIKTGGQEGLPVYATKRGYISRIKVSTSGYGNALYMLHPDGNTSVYAHLREFSDEIAKYVRAAQYENKTYEIELFPDPYEFAFQRGDVIAKSGNTGGSTGPHLHFEIRDEQQRVLNPLHYGFDEIKDNIAPIAQRLAVRPININSRVENRFDRKDYYLSRYGVNYAINDTITAFGKIGIELLGHDKLDGAANQNGISTIEVFVNDEKYHSQIIDVMSFSLMRDIIVHYPYDIKVNKGRTYHNLYVDNGNRLNFYESKANNGYLNIEADSTYHVEIKMHDPYGNISTVTLNIKGKAPAKQIKERIDFELDRISYQVEKNILKVFTRENCEEDANKELSIYINDSIKTVLPAYFLNNVAVYLWDLHEGIPTSVLSCNKGVNISINARAIPHQATVINAENFIVNFPQSALYDTIYVSTAYEVRTQDSLEVFSIEPVTVPLKSSFYVSASPQFSHYQKDKTHVYQTDDAGNFSFVGGSWSGETIQFNHRSMGEFTLVTDDTPPVIRPATEKNYYYISDNLSGIASYTASLNGEWIMMRYEPKLRLVWIEWPEGMQNKRGSFELKVKDNAGNETIYTTKL